MSDTDPNAPPPAAPPATPPAPAQVTMPSDQFASRLAEERQKAVQKVLKDLGVESLDSVKNVLTANRAAEEASKTETEKLRSRIGELEPHAKRVADLEAVVKARAEAEMGTLTDAQRTAVTALGGEDPAAQLRAITALRPTWTAAATPAATPPPANTAPANAAPPPPAPAGSPPNHRAIYEQMRKTDPIRAAQYLTRHRFDIYPNNS